MANGKKLTATRRQFGQGAVAAGAAAAVAGGAPTFVEAAGDTLRVRNYSDIQVLDPGYILSAPETDVNLCLLNGLVTYKSGEEWDWELDAAAAIEQVDNTHITFTLRNDLGWTNGFGEMTADDVKFSYERVADPAMESPYAEDWIALDHVEVIDDRSGVIVLKEPYAPLWTTTMPAGRGMIISRKAVEALPGMRYEAEPPCVSGPYQIKEWVPGQKLTLETIDGYAGPFANPAFSKIEIYPIVDESTAEVAFLAGELDLTTVPPTSLIELEENPPENATLVQAPSLKYVWMGINQDNEQFQDIRLRQAVQYAINVNDIMEAAYFGAAKPATGIIPPGLVGYRDAPLIAFEGDPDYSRTLLEEAGMPNGFDCRLDVLNKPTYLSACQVIQANLADVGINVEINVHDPGVWWTMGDESSGDDWKNLQIMYNRFSSNPDPGWYTMWFTPQQVGIWNWERYNNAEFAELHAQALVTIDPAVRQGMYVEMQDLMEESGCYRFITNELTPTLYSDAIVPSLGPDGRMFWKSFKNA